MAPVVYRLIDGNFLRSLCESLSQEIGFEFWAALDWTYITKGDRTFIYDSLPAKKPSQSDTEFQANFDARLADLDRLRRLPNVFVKDGFSRFRKKVGQEQKGVDILLATDAILFAHRGIADELHIYTNDLDFFPVFEALQSTSCRGRLFHSPEKPPNDLLPFTDSAEAVRINLLLEACGVGWGHSNSIYTLGAGVAGETPFLVGESIHSGAFEMRFYSIERSFEVKYFINSRCEFLITKSPVLAYGIAEKFMKNVPAMLLSTLRGFLSKP